RDSARNGARGSFGEVVDTIYHFDKADVVVSLDADFLGWGPARLRDARHFAARRESATRPGEVMNRLYVAEPSPSITGAMADSRLPVSSWNVGGVAQAIARGLSIDGMVPDDQGFTFDRAWVDTVVKDLLAHQGSSLVLAGVPQ